MKAKKKKRKPPVNYDRDIKPHVKQILKWREEGRSQAEICEALNCSEAAFSGWIKTKDELKEEYARATEIGPIKIAENALLKRVQGCTVKEVRKKEVLDRDGNIVVLTEEITKELPPDPSSIVFFLTNLARDKWKKMPEAAEVIDEVTKAIAIIPKREILEQPKGEINDVTD